MVCENELRFLCDTLKKCRVSAKVVTPNEPLSRLVDDGFAPLFEEWMADDIPIGRLMGELEPGTMYKSVNTFKLRYIYLLLPESSPTMLLIGPYTHASLTPRQMLEIAEQNGFPPKQQKVLDQYYENIPIIPENSHLFVMLDTFCEHLWGVSYTVADMERDWLLPELSVTAVADNGEFDDAQVSMVRMEQRYRYENELMQAVSRGQTHKVNQMFSNFSNQVFEKRSADPLRNMKNYCIITNTLLRKAAEQGGVHPIHLDRVSSAFAIKIEQLSPSDEGTDLMREMFRTYARLVRQHSTKDYSPVVQKAILQIEADLSANLTLSSLAQAQNISSGYLSSVFKKETGKTVTEYIREKRMQYAAHLLATTHLQIQTVALHCGIIDVQYFSKIFKKQTGKTPKEYRDSTK